MFRLDKSLERPQWFSYGGHHIRLEENFLVADKVCASVERGVDIVTLTVKEVPVYFTLKEFPFQRNAAVRTVVIVFPITSSSLPPMGSINGPWLWVFINWVKNKTETRRGVTTRQKKKQEEKKKKPLYNTIHCVCQMD